MKYETMKKLFSILLGGKIHGKFDSSSNNYIFFEKLKNIDSYWKEFDKKPDFNNKKVLEIGSGCGTLAIDIALSGAKQVVGIDLDQKLVDFANKKVLSDYPKLSKILHFFRCEIKDLKEYNFDYIISQNAFEHIYELDKLLVEMEKRLKSGSKIYSAFGPLFYSPFGDHRAFHRIMEKENNIKIPQIIFPWMHLMIPENFLNNFVKYFYKRKSGSEKEFKIYGTLNKLRLSEYNKIFNQSKFNILLFKTNCILRVFPFLKELFTRSIAIVLMKSKSIKNISSQPFVSVIVPVYNDPKKIEICIKKLLRQTYPKNKYEIIIVDNNSTDKTPKVVRKYPVKLFFEKNIQSSYAARNKGLKKAKGEIIAFTDSDCQPNKEWLENGVKSLLEKECDLVAGKVSFLFKNKNNAYEIYDSIYNVQQEEKVLKGEAATANLFIWKYVFDKIGFFPNNVKSGGDATLTNRASSKGFNLVYEPTAELYHPTRNKKELLKKQIRVGYGQIPKWAIKKKNPLVIFLIILKDFLPPSILNYKKIGENNSLHLFLKVYTIKWKSSIFTNIGRLTYLSDKFFGKIR
jgi:glycosyltransferase AglE